MTDEQIIEQLLYKYLPLESELAGEDTVRAIIYGAKPSVPKHGESFDLTPVFEILATTTTIISNLLIIYITLKERNKRPPTVSELKNEKLELPLPDTLNKHSDEFFKDFIDAVAPWHNENNKSSKKNL